MSGELFDVLSFTRFAAFDQCPVSMDGVDITLKSSDGSSYTLDGRAASMSGMIRKNFREKGPDYVHTIPLKKATLMKVVEYMNYHKDIPAKELAIPLISEDLKECGVLKWDIDFIKVDKDYNFELMLAGSALGIPSLEMLAVLQAMKLVKGKSADKIRKEFGCQNDLPDDEEGDLMEFYNTSVSGKNILPDEAGVAGTAALLQGLAQAAEKNGIYYATGSETASSPSCGTKSWRGFMWRAAVSQDWKMLSKAPKEVRGDRDLLLTAIYLSRGLALKYASDDLRADTEVILAAVRFGGEFMQEASTSLRQDAAFMMEAIMVEGTSLVGGATSLRSDKTIILEAASRGRGSAMKGAVSALQSDRDLLLQCVELDPETFRYAASDLRQDKEFTKKVVGKNGKALQYALGKFKADKDVVAVALASDGASAAYAHASRRADAGVRLDVDSQVAHLAEKKLEDAASSPSEIVSGGPMLMGIPLVSEQSQSFLITKMQKMVQFSALSSLGANMGQSNYIASNMMLDKLPFYERPEFDSVTIMWGAVGGIGMRWKAFASADFLNQTPEILMSVEDCCKVLHMITCRMDTPEWTTGCLNVPDVQPTAGGGTGGGYKPLPGENASVPLSLPSFGGKVIEEEVMDADPDEYVLPAGGVDPLANWPELSGRNQGIILCFEEGARVRLLGCKAWDGATGTLLRYTNGKWKVKLDDGRGHALLKSDYMEVFAAPDSAHLARLQQEALEEEAAKRAKRASRLAATRTKC
mmetsp:Transcript_46822/g.100126  ORF Transcript_46822/g.100126 Transcript_46822/m.100126 type:complete len:754 (+) Transcript_46822:80-2341(+)